MSQTEIPSLFSLSLPVPPGAGGDHGGMQPSVTSQSSASQEPNTFQIENWDNEMANNIPNMNSDTSSQQGNNFVY